MLVSPRRNGLDSLFKEVRVFKEERACPSPQACDERIEEEEDEERPPQKWEQVRSCSNG